MTRIEKIIYWWKIGRHLGIMKETKEEIKRLKRKGKLSNKFLKKAKKYEKRYKK